MDEANLTLEILVVAVAMCGVCLGALNSLTLCLQSWMDRHKVQRLVLTKERQQKKKNTKFWEDLARVVSDASTNKSSTRDDSPKRECSEGEV